MGVCRNRQCQCGSVEGVPICGDRCEDRGYCQAGACGGNTVHVTDCRGIARGDRGGVISYCDRNPCVPNQGSACSRCNSCGMCNNGSIQCNGSCNVGAPSEALCGSPPTGTHSFADCNATGGTASDPDYAGAIAVHLYEGATFLGTTSANPNWSWTIPAGLKNGLNHTITAYAINVNSSGNPQGANPQLTGTPKVINCNQPPTGTLTTAVCGTPNGSATGTATDPQSGSVVVAIYDGQAGAGGVQIGTGNATPNFNIPFTSFLNGQTHYVYAYGQDVPTGTWSQLSAPIAVTCPPTVTVSANPNAIDFAETSNISWTVQNATSCTASPLGWYNPASLVNGQANSSANSGPLISSTTFSLTCQNAVGTQTVGSANVSVTAPPPVGTIVSVTDTDYCTVGAGMIIDWKYDSAASNISAYQVEILDGGGNVVFDTGKTPKTALATAPARTAKTATEPSRLANITNALVSGFMNLFINNQ